MAGLFGEHPGWTVSEVTPEEWDALREREQCVRANPGDEHHRLLGQRLRQ